MPDWANHDVVALLDEELQPTEHALPLFPSTGQPPQVKMDTITKKWEHDAAGKLVKDAQARAAKGSEIRLKKSTTPNQVPSNKAKAQNQVPTKTHTTPNQVRP